MIVWIFCAEVAEMYCFSVLEPLSVGVEAVIDGLVLIVMISPAYFLFYRPLLALSRERQQSEREIRHLSRSLLAACETERKRLAQDLHDQCGQTITALQFGMETLQSVIAGGHRKPERQIEKLSALISQLGRDMRAITGNLRPMMLDELGLIPALRWHVKEFGRTMPHLQAGFEAGGCDRRLAPEAEVALFRICQEALNNVAKHSQAQKVEVGLVCSENRTIMTIIDDGIGFDLREIREKREASLGIGLVGMRERIAAMGGTMTIRTRAGSGTCVEIALPRAKEFIE